MFWLYLFFALFFAAVLLLVGWYQLRQHDKKLLDQLESGGVVTRHHKRTPGRV